MKTRSYLVSLLTVVSILLAACASNAVVETTKTAGKIGEGGLFKEYLDSRAFRDPLEEFLRNHADWLDDQLGLSTPERRVFEDMRIYIDQAVKFEQGSEYPEEGIWLVKINEISGPDIRKFNVFCIAVDGEAPDMKAGILGDSLCNYRLQSDLRALLSMAESAMLNRDPVPGEPLIILDARVTDLSKWDVGSRRGSWTEEWILAAGEKRLTMSIFLTQVSDTKTNYQVTFSTSKD